MSQSAERADALNGSNFDPRYIISDMQFYSHDAMTAAEIQAFLDAKIGTCLNSNCINIKRTDTWGEPADAQCAAYTGASAELTSTIIFKVQQACGISAKVLLVTLQKEQGLVTDTSPSLGKLERAMGYYCPDDPANPGWCDPRYAGLYRQILNAAWQFKRYSTPTPWGNYQPGAPISIAFHPNDACGSASVAIRNNATAALYNYTPYVPNSAALANLDGTGDSCSSYGNRNFWVFYNAWFGNPTGVVPAGASVTRISGEDRYETSAQVSTTQGSATGGTVYIASGYDFPDALGGSPAAIASGGPLLLVAQTFVSGSAQTELTRLAPSRIIVLGGEASITASAFEQLQGFAPETVRIAGEDRYETSRMLAEFAFKTSTSHLGFVATGEGFPDALAASAAAGITGAPIILVPGSAAAVDPETIALLDRLGINQTIIVGGMATVSTGMQDSLAAIPGMTVERLSGADRFATASAINREFFSTSSTVLVASGRSFPDALSGSALAGSLGAALYLTESSCIYRQTAQDMIDLGMTHMILLGGRNALAPSVGEFLNCD